MRKILIANRGEIAVRIARACADATIGSVAVYADPDRDSLHTKVADEAYALRGMIPRESYLAIDKLLTIAKRSGADAVHPGYGFLAENAEFAEAVISAGLTWIGPGPDVIRKLGDKVAARRIAHQAGAPLVPGTEDPITGPAEALDFARSNGLPVAIKAAFGGGGRGLKVARTMAEVPEMYESAVREAVAAFGRGECFVERYLDHPRHVETQCLADTHGHVVVISTRDCSLQRRHQKLVEEAPAPFLSDPQNAELYRASKAIMRQVGYVGAGTCEFLVGQDGTISFLEVNTRLQVEHPVSEEVTGIDLVWEMFRIADGEPLDYDDPPVRGHSLEFRINGEDSAREFLPVPGQITTWNPPFGPGVRLDSGIEIGAEIGSTFDSLLAKLIVTGATRAQALARARRALAEFTIGGIPTVLPFHRAVVTDPAFAPSDPATPFSVHTRWVETEFDHPIAEAGPAEHGLIAGTEENRAERLTVEVNDKRFEVVLPAGFALISTATPTGCDGDGRPTRRAGRPAGAAVGRNALAAPMQGTIVKIAVEEGQPVAAGDLVVVIEAMKMEQPITAHKAGTIRSLTAIVGNTVACDAALCEIVKETAPGA